MSAQSKRNLLVHIRALLNYYNDEEYIVGNVAASKKQRRHAKRGTDAAGKTLTRDQARALLLAVVGSEVEAEVAVALGTGGRRGEICALRWTDVDLDEGTIHFARAFPNVGRAGERRVIVKLPKSDASLRRDALSPGVIRTLERQRIAQAERHAKLGLPQGELVFTRFDGRAWYPNELSRIFGRTLRRLKVTPIRFHDLRHTFASLSFASGVSMKLVSQSLGHSSLAVTDRLYVHIIDDQRRQAALQRDTLVAPVLPAISGSVSPR